MNAEQAKQQLKLWSVEAAMRMRPVEAGKIVNPADVLADADQLYAFVTSETVTSEPTPEAQA